MEENNTCGSCGGVGSYYSYQVRNYVCDEHCEMVLLDHIHDMLAQPIERDDTEDEQMPVLIF